MRAIFFTLGFILVTLGIEHGIAPFIGQSWDHIRPTEMRLAAMGIILVGFLRRDWEVAFFATAVALPWAVMSGPERMGCTIISFVTVGWLATGMVRFFYLEQFSIRFAVLFGLILLESWIWSASRQLFWPELTVDIQWPTHLALALVGAVVYLPLRHYIRYSSASLTPIGRRPDK